MSDNGVLIFQDVDAFLEFMESLQEQYNKKEEVNMYGKEND